MVSETQETRLKHLSDLYSTFKVKVGLTSNFWVEIDVSLAYTLLGNGDGDGYETLAVGTGTSSTTNVE